MSAENQSVNIPSNFVFQNAHSPIEMRWHPHSTFQRGCHMLPLDWSGQGLSYVSTFYKSHLHSFRPACAHGECIYINEITGAYSFGRRKNKCDLLPLDALKCLAWDPNRCMYPAHPMRGEVSGRGGEILKPLYLCKEERFIDLGVADFDFFWGITSWEAIYSKLLEKRFSKHWHWLWAGKKLSLREGEPWNVSSPFFLYYFDQNYTKSSNKSSKTF